MRVLQSEVRRIGPEPTLLLMCAYFGFERDLLAVAASRFRPDLYYRLRVLPFNFPNYVAVMTFATHRTPPAHKGGPLRRDYTTIWCAMRAMVEYPGRETFENLKMQLNTRWRLGVSKNQIFTICTEVPARTPAQPTSQILAAYAVNRWLKSRNANPIRCNSLVIRSAAALGIDADFIVSQTVWRDGEVFEEDRTECSCAPV